MSRWFRLYAEVLDDPKVQRLPPSLFKTWVNVLCLAANAKAGVLPPIDDIAFRLRLSAHEATQQIDELILAGLIDIGVNGEWTPHAWDKRQYTSDSSAERVRKHREKKKAEDGCNVTASVTRNVTVTSQNRTDQIRTDSETDQTRRERSRSAGGFQNIFLGVRGSGVGEKVRQRVEGLGIEAADLLADAAKPDVKTPDAYFVKAVGNRIRTRLPTLSQDAIERGLRGKDEDYARLMDVVLKSQWPSAGVPLPAWPEA